MKIVTHDYPYHHSVGDSRLVHWGFPKYEGYQNRMEIKKMKGNNSGWMKIDSKIFKFEKLKDEISGELLSKEKGMNYDNEVYKIRDDSGDVWTVFSTVVMQSQMSSVKVGSQVRIVLIDVKDNKKKGQNPIKMFDTYVR